METNSNWFEELVDLAYVYEAHLCHSSSKIHVRGVYEALVPFVRGFCEAKLVARTRTLVLLARDVLLRNTQRVAKQSENME